MLKTQPLDLQFHNGAIYRYFGVPEQVFQQLLTQDSAGRYFNRQIRHHFPYHLLRSPD